jgi:hypothetical protein
MNVEEHLLCCLGEEGTEIAKDCSKAMRFGLGDVNFMVPEGPNNQERIVDELNDLMGVVQLMVKNGILPADWQDRKKQRRKMKRVLDCMEYARKQGALE